jgi:16S rRNA (uracil1498-N3)-methyltransferase
MHYFFYSFDKKELNQNLSISKKENPELFHQITKVLRLKFNERITLLNNSDFKFVFQIDNIGNKIINLKLIEKKKNETELKTTFHLFLALPKKDKLELIIQKAVELGIQEITPIITQRTVKLNINEKRLNKIIIEASEQCHASKIIKFNGIKKLTEIKSNNLNLILDPYAEKHISSVKNLIKKENTNLFIGPEGGFSDEEVQSLLKLENSHNINLGKRILRLETAAISTMAILTNYLYE